MVPSTVIHGSWSRTIFDTQKTRKFPQLSMSLQRLPKWNFTSFQTLAFNLRSLMMPSTNFHLLFGTPTSVDIFPSAPSWFSRLPSTFIDFREGTHAVACVFASTCIYSHGLLPLSGKNCLRLNALFCLLMAPGGLHNLLKLKVPPDSQTRGVPVNCFWYFKETTVVTLIWRFHFKNLGHIQQLVYYPSRCHPYRSFRRLLRAFIDFHQLPPTSRSLHVLLEKDFRLLPSLILL